MATPTSTPTPNPTPAVTPHQKQIATHYNSLRDLGLDHRANSSILTLRSFNNWIKSMLISETIQKVPSNHPLTVLDLCCGKGGDIQKWVKSTRKIRHVVFADIAEISVNQCQDRYRNLNRAGVQRDLFTAEFITMDATRELLREKLANPEETKFDLVSCQFSFHYSFESAAQAMRMLENVAGNLKPGGYFVGTTTNANRLVRLLRSSTSSQRNSFGNHVFRVEFESEEPFPIFGAKYRFRLAESLVDCPEFLVNLNVFEELAQRVGLELVFVEGFEDYWRRAWLGERNHAKELAERMGALETYPKGGGRNSGPEDSPSSDHYSHADEYLRAHPDVPTVGTLSGPDWATASLYICFCFRKTL